MRKEEQERARITHRELEEHCFQQQHAGNLTAGQPTDEPGTGSANANVLAAEAFLSRMQPTSPAEPAASQDEKRLKPQYHHQEQHQQQSRSKKHGAVVKGHAIDALSAAVKPALKRYYKSKAISSADDFKHLYAMKD